MKVKINKEELLKAFDKNLCHDGYFEVEAEPVEGPEWEKKFRDFTVEALKKQGYEPYPDHIYDWTDIFKMGYLDDLFSFIRTEIIEKICEETAKDLHKAESEVCWTPKSSDIVKAIKARWLGRKE